MRILQVIHDFLPRHNAGSEIYTYHLTRDLAARHTVAVFCTECVPERAQYSLSERTWEGIPIFEAVHNQTFQNFEQTYRDPRMDRVFRGILRRFRPDVVHLQHLQYHSIDYVREAHDLGIPVLFTLHEYFLQCPRKGLMLREDLSLCPDVDVQRCADCMAHDTMTPMILGEKRFRLNEWAKTHVPARLRRMVHKRLVKYRIVPPPSSGPSEGSGEARGGRDFAREIRDRRDAVLERCREVDLFLAPSRYLEGMFVRFGIPPERIRFSDYGFVDAGYRNVPRVPSPRVRFGFIGTLVAFKGAHLAIEAFHQIDQGKAELRIYGDPGIFPPYAERLRAMIRRPDCRLMGRFENREVARILAEIDVLIVPSLWYENSPLTIHEAFLAGVPVLTTDLGGMADLVSDAAGGGGGLCFRRGDPDSLAEKMAALVDEPERIAELAAGIPRVKSIEEDARRIEEAYREIIGRRQRASGIPAEAGGEG